MKDTTQTTKQIIYDIESNGLLKEASTIHCIGVKINDEETMVYTSRPIKGSSGSISDALDILNDADKLIGHNAIKFDNACIRKLYGIDYFVEHSYFDTLIASQLAYPNMLLIDSNNKKLDPKLRGKHSLSSWGQRLGNHKEHHEDWSQLTEEMVEYCRQDIEVTSTLYNKLKDKVPEEAMRLEQKFAYVIQKQEEHGVLFDVPKARKLHVELIKEQEEAIETLHKVFKPLLMPSGKPKEPKKEFRRLGVSTVGIHQPIELTEFNPKSGQHVVRWVERLYGKQKWELTEKGSPKTGEDDLIRMFKDKPWASPLVHYLQVKKLLGQLAEGNNAWLKLVDDEDGRIHGEVNTIGAVSRRCTHNSPNLAQVGSVRSFKGAEVRSLFTVPTGYKMVGCDMSGLELRVFAHYLARYDNGKYAKVILNEDIHTFNQKAFGVPTRDMAKTTIYGTLYGAGADKIGSIVGKDAKEGAKIKRNFEKNVPAYKLLCEGVEEAVKSKGWLRAIDGNRFFIRSQHSALNTLLQGTGALLCKQWAIMVYEEMERRGYIFGKDYAMVLQVHDECDYEVKEELAEELAKIAKECTTKAGEYFKIRMRLDGESKIGSSWYDIH